MDDAVCCPLPSFSTISHESIHYSSSRVNMACKLHYCWLSALDCTTSPVSIWRRMPLLAALDAPAVSPCHFLSYALFPTIHHFHQCCPHCLRLPVITIEKLFHHLLLPPILSTRLIKWKSWFSGICWTYLIITPRQDKDVEFKVGRIWYGIAAHSYKISVMMKNMEK